MEQSNNIFDNIDEEEIDNKYNNTTNKFLNFVKQFEINIDNKYKSDFNNVFNLYLHIHELYSSMNLLETIDETFEQNESNINNFTMIYNTLINNFNQQILLFNNIELLNNQSTIQSNNIQINSDNIKLSEVRKQLTDITSKYISLKNNYEKFTNGNISINNKDESKNQELQLAYNNLLVNNNSLLQTIETLKNTQNEVSKQNEITNDLSDELNSIKSQNINLLDSQKIDQETITKLKNDIKQYQLIIAKMGNSCIQIPECKQIYDNSETECDKIIKLENEISKLKTNLTFMYRLLQRSESNSQF